MYIYICIYICIYMYIYIYMYMYMCIYIYWLHHVTPEHQHWVPHSFLKIHRASCVVCEPFGLRFGSTEVRQGVPRSAEFIGSARSPSMKRRKLQFSDFLNNNLEVFRASPDYLLVILAFTALALMAPAHDEAGREKA